MQRDVIIIGAGAAGLMCAIEAGKRGRSVLVLEHAEKVGKKILISGGGRCNFTNTNTGADNFLSANPNFCKSALARYTPYDFIKMVERHRIPFHEKKLGQLFCDGSSGEIVRMLLDECGAVRVEIRTGCSVREVKKPHLFTVESDQGVFSARSLVIATGGLSIPKIGATDFGHRLAKRFNLRVTKLKPALVPLTLHEKERKTFSGLSGVSLAAKVGINNGKGVQFEENILLTHRGLSGPAVLQISSYWNGTDSVNIDLLPDIMSHDFLLEHARETAELTTVLGERLPKRFAQKWCELYAPSKPINCFSTKELLSIADLLKNWTILPGGTEGFAKAEVTLGGIDTDELSSKTMEAKRVPGLYFIGEVVDVTGHLGGYNFQWAWASGFAAGQYI